MSENDVVNSCLQFLKLKGIFAWRNNTGAMKISRENGKQGFYRFGFKGSSDILGILPSGKFLAVECKFGKGKLTENQIRFLQEIGRNGGIAVCVWSVEDLEKYFLKNGLTR